MPQGSLLQFADKMNEVMPQVIKGFARRQDNELYKGKITLQQFLVLEFLNRMGVSNMTSLAHYMAVTTAAMTGIVDRLVRDNYVLRVYEPEDRRIIKIKITARGQELVKKITEQRRKIVVNIFGQLPEKDRNDYLRILMLVKDVLNKEKPD